jgi:hypothetical protein
MPPEAPNSGRSVVIPRATAAAVLDSKTPVSIAILPTRGACTSHKITKRPFCVAQNCSHRSISRTFLMLFSRDETMACVRPAPKRGWLCEENPLHAHEPN